uniref:Uncharacterized protein n=1 Tax=Anguilla anguilla TaxID=7936 RepID=A0A0E9VQA7_ANGAN
MTISSNDSSLKFNGLNIKLLSTENCDYDLQSLQSLTVWHVLTRLYSLS